METLLATMETELASAVFGNVEQERINALWIAGETHAAARAYVLEYARKNEFKATIVVAMPCREPDAGEALDVFFCVDDNKEHRVFTVWFEDCISRVYGEW